ncbi:MAG: S8 family peptidase [Bacteroidales bacterium]|jgi:subtilisin family serine protease|nr:S8 family peptidase [Bacteroidales bacterium]
MKNFIYIYFFLFSINTFSQVSPDKYFIEFTDKNNTGFSIEHPDKFLTQRALERRHKQNIPVDNLDLPVNNEYIDSLKKLGLEILNISKWFNSVTVYTTNKELIDTITKISFVKSVLVPSNISLEGKSFDDNTFLNKRGDVKKSISSNYYDYGESQDQIFINNGQYLHNDGFRGKGMLIAITDAGFSYLPDLPSFDSIYAENRVITTRNFVRGGDFVYDYSTHGMKVFSILAGNYPGYLIGSAPEASYLLLMTEDPGSETYIEEINWISAAEFADSLGVDVINVSLGYVSFDTPEFSHNYSDMDGKTAIISRAATIAARKGIIVVSSAANSGNSSTHPWIAAPGDADSILTVGAIGFDKKYASFSSIGPSADGRVKPDVMAMGQATALQEINGSVGRGNGTSFSSPVIAGLTACLWQKFPERSNIEIINAIRIASDSYYLPSDSMGYGIPDFKLAAMILEILTVIPGLENDAFYVFPNPFTDTIEIKINNAPGDRIKISVTDLSGRVIYNDDKYIVAETYDLRLTINDLDKLPKGIYIVTLTINNQKYSKKIIKG